VKFEAIAGREYATNFVIAIHRTLTMQLDFPNADSVATGALGRGFPAAGRFSAQLQFDRQSGPQLLGWG
jgi:hypothetical protein